MTDGSVPVNAGDVIDGKYRIERVLGTGGMGVVVVATHLQLEQQVAIKFLLPAAAKSTEAVARFAREARASAKIQSEHVARVLDVATHVSGAPYMVMEYLEGKDLERTLEEHKALPVEHVVDYVLQALEALAEAHVAGIVHRDLKPANIFLARRADGSSVVKVLDFGISKLTSDKTAKLTSESAQMGSPLYMSPEQLNRTREVDARADIWAVGVILHELLSGEAPFIAETLPEIIAGILSLPPLRLRLHHPEIPVELEAVVLKCLAKDPDNRYADVAQLAVALGPFAPERSRVSIERIVRVIAGRKEISLPPSSKRGAGATQVGPGPRGATSFTEVVAPEAIAPVPAASNVFEPEPPSIRSAWQTTGRVRPGRPGRRFMMGVAAGVIVAAAAVTGVLLFRSSGPPGPVPAATSSPATTTTTTTTAEAPPLPLPPPSAAPSDTPALASSIPFVSLSSLPSVPSASAAPPSRPVRPASPTNAGPAKPAPDDFGGRK